MALDGNKTIEYNIAYHPTPYPRDMRNHFTEIAQVCDGVYIPFTESDLRYAPRVIKNGIDLAHDANLIAVVDIWGLGNLFASPAVPSLFTVSHPEHNCVTNRGRTVPKTCPRSEAFRAYVRDLLGEFLAGFEPDGVFWDEPQWGLPEYYGKLEEGEWICACDGCKAAFRESYGTDMPDRMTDEVAAFRDQALLEFLGELCTLAKNAGEHLITSTCVMPGDRPGFKEAVARTPNLDIFGIDPYWRPDMDVSQKTYIDEHTGEAVRIARANGKLVEAWVCAYDISARHERDPYRAAKIAAAHDIDCLSAWSYRDGQSWAALDRRNPADPDLVWENLRQAYREIRDGNLEIET